MSKVQTKDLTQGPLLKQLIVFTLPLFLSLLLQTLYNSADRFVVGKFADSLALAAMGNTGYATNILVTLVTGLATGANVVIGNLLGSRKLDDVRKVMHDSVGLSMVCGIVVCAVGILISRPLLEILGTPEEVMDASNLYMIIIFCGTPASAIYNFGAAILRSHGDTKRPMFILGATGLVNVILNLVFVIVFHMDVAGVALATIIAQYCSAAWILGILFSPKDQFRLSLKEVQFFKGQTGAIVRIGISCSFYSSLVNMAGLFIQSSINSMGATVMSGSTASDSITAITMTIPTAFFTGCTTFASQCFGARNFKRMDHMVLMGAGVVFGLVAAISVVCTLFPEPLLYLFTSDPSAVETGVIKLICVSWGFTISGAGQVFTGALRGMRCATATTVICTVCLVVVRILWTSFVFPVWHTPLGLYIIFPITFSLNAVCQVVYYLIRRKQLWDAPSRI